MKKFIQKWKTFWFQSEDPNSLGAFRISFYLGNFIIFNYVGVGDHYLTPIEFYEQKSFFHIFNIQIVNFDDYRTLFFVWKISMLTACLGLLTRVSTLTCFLIGFYLLGIQYNFGYLLTFESLSIQVMLIMCFSRSGNFYSLDNLIRREIGEFKADYNPSYSWPNRLIKVIFILSFFSSALAGLYYKGLNWVFSDNFRFTVIQFNFGALADQNNSPILAGLISYNPNFSIFVAAFILLVKFLSPIIFIHRKLVFCVLPVLFFIQLFEYLVFFDRTIVYSWPIYLIWLDWRKILLKPVK